jgi:predicted glycosyltransferase
MPDGGSWLADNPRPAVIFDSHHPKDYMAIRQLGQRCLDTGMQVLWTVRDKDVMVPLIRENGFDPIPLTRARKGLARKVGELVVYDWKLAALARRVRPVAFVGKTVTLAQVGWLLGIPSLLINDDSAAANPQYRYLAAPFATRIVTSDCLGEDYGARQRTYSGLMELAYLHPDVFAPDPGIRAELGVGAHERIFLIRLAAFDAYHDVGGRGLSRRLLDRVLARLSPLGRIFVVSEAPLADDLKRHALPVAASRLHHVIAAADLVLGDGLTVCVEAALLGVPAIAVGSYVGKHRYAEAVEKRFGLLYGFKPEQEGEFLARLDDLLNQPGIHEEWARRRAAMLREWRDPTDVYWEELQRLLAPALGARMEPVWR